MFLKEIFLGIWNFLNPIPDFDSIEDGYFSDEDYFGADTKNGDKKERYSFKSEKLSDEKMQKAVDDILKTKYRNMDSALDIVRIIDSCDYHEEKVQLVSIYIREYNRMPENLDDILSDGFDSQYKMERLSLTYSSILNALVKTSLNLGNNIEAFSDYFTRVVFSKPYSIF